MEKKLTRPQKTVPERNQSKSEQHSDGSQNISCGNTVRNSIIKRTANIRNRKNASNSGRYPVKRMPAFYQRAQSTGSEAVVEKDSTLLTTPTQSFPLTTGSVYANLSNVGGIENETRSYPGSPAPYDALIEDKCKRHTESPPNSTKTLKCRVCKKEFNPMGDQYHLMAHHPEVFFDDIVSPDVNFNASCLGVLEDKIYEGKQLMKEKEKKGYKKRSGKGIWCKYCNTDNEKRNTQYLKVHLFRYHHNILKEMLMARCPKSKVANATIASEHIPNTEFTTMTVFNHNMEPDHKQNFTFACNVVGNSTNKVVGNTRSTWFTAATSTDEVRYGEDFQYGIATAWLNDQEAVLGTAPFPNHLSQMGISSITESSNNVNTVMTNQIKQYYPTTIASDNWQYFHPPAPVDKQHQVGNNQQVSTLNSSQMYSVHPQGSNCNDTTMDDVPDWEADLHIATEYLREEYFNFNASLDPDYNPGNI